MSDAAIAWHAISSCARRNTERAGARRRGQVEQERRDRRHARIYSRRPHDGKTSEGSREA
jgi:hypothetical protein